MSKYRLAKSIGVPAQRIGDIISGKRGIYLAKTRTFASAASSACLMAWRLRLQVSHDTTIAQRKMATDY